MGLDQEEQPKLVLGCGCVQKEEEGAGRADSMHLQEGCSDTEVEVLGGVCISSFFSATARVNQTIPVPVFGR